ncbi:D-arabinono-1,4-lactone oxidase [Sphaerisporangium corydalis]|uniref:D-arabinono-1,4-lactone oxidase n=1 Tax=Sphaerisporangium corydalis TaxID=1441875 RepID=A0ABV9EL45_9ACTN|nr:D-arabinono-1,4-lactone oxidase [Sphaerisporangium corydalis]
MFRAEHVDRPSSLSQLRGLVSRSREVRVLGSGHSFNAIADSAGTLVSLDGLPRTIEIDSASATVKVAASVRYAELGARLHAEGYALRNLASLPHISVAGSCATATHGSGDANGNLATAVSAIEMVTAGGDVVVLGRDTDGDRFEGAVVALGALGAVVSLTLDLVPAFDVRQYVYEGLAGEVLDEHFDDVFSSAYSVSLFTGWRTSVIDQAWVKHRLDASPAPDASRAGDPAPAGSVGATTADGAGNPFFGATMADGPRHPVPGVSAVHCTRQAGVPGPWFERLPHFRPDFTPSAGEELQSEYLVPREHAVAALRALAGLRDHIAPVLQISEIRTVAADRLWLSTAYGRESVAIHFTWIKDPAAVLPVLGLIEERLAPFEARPHWGKLFTVAPEVLRSRYERLPDFRDLVAHFDPTGTFTNDFLRDHLLGAP